MGATHDLIVPGSGTVAAVLSTILQLCGEMKEWQDPCTRLHQRLKNVFEGLKTLEKKKKRLPPPEALDKYVTVVSTTLCYLEHYRGKKLVFRLMKHQAMMEELRVINEKTDVVVRALGLTSADTGKWKKQYEDDQRIHRELLASSVDNAQEVLAELQDARSQQETMLTLKYEVELRPEQQDAEMTKLLRTMMATVIRTSTTSVPKLPPWFLPPYEIRFDPKPFARGSFATVHRGVRGSDTNVVVKCFLVDGADVDERTRQNIEAEMNLLHQFDHPNVVKLLGASHMSTPPFIVCEDATNGDLRSFLARSDANKLQLWKLLYQAALGLEYIHKKSVVHGDLKLNNVLVGAEGQAKLSDFGLSAVRTSAILSESTPYTAGALRWRAPECLKMAPTSASDVYSFAMCIIEAVIGEPPFALLDDDSVHEKLRNGEIPEKPEKMSAEVWELVAAMTNVDPTKRISLSRVLKTLKDFADGNLRSPPQAANPASELTENANLALVDTEIIVGILDNVSAMDDQAKEQSMLQLVRICVEDEERPVMYEADAIQILTNLVKSGRNNYTKLYALQCLKWAAVVDAKLPKLAFD
ncbi:hypothetical protein PF005_g11931 [Phytophthora fragariae]|uniref:Protein kinase domain-containing protein n=1 Tax=Phytophthora fragariae TaxID=53985 RepID=A0A6A4DJA8_9STRA|nr:hypothetical protein PF003_g33964 [Phytophthora fragariae]KAE8936071.1 hypothetical protein PF009_g13998 [Phytophthora fragariae]KAE9107076.1 hypothetical protein PF010_g12405 [Phytophthora fragariae]KAE9107399.1 hypothetical protein PF007_g13059 [Phytophthora fragariae]KAE9209166.1 hypothetical protein PF005_g11931 [Phytophthora fragariae]